MKKCVVNLTANRNDLGFGPRISLQTEQVLTEMWGLFAKLLQYNQINR